MKMKFRDLEFITNPTTLRVAGSVDINKASIIGEKSITKSTGVNPMVVEGNGQVFGEEGERWCALLTHIMRQASAGWLFVPNASPIVAYLEKFDYSQSSKRGAIEYSFRFTEKCNAGREVKALDVITALDGENAFTLAEKYNTAVERIMELNDFENPFSICAGDKVVLR